MIFRVDAERFAGWSTYLLNMDDVKKVLWYVDDEYLHCYLTWNSETYYYTTRKNNIPSSIQGLLSERGQILGVILPENKIQENQTTPINLFTKGVSQ